MKLWCTECSQGLAGFEDLCRHRNPVGLCCCDDVHPVGYSDEEEAA